jgi:F420-non-reducing hydrogenase small subunit
MYVATVALSSCGGCHQSLFMVGEPLIALLCDNNISFSNYLMDTRAISPSDVVLATGAIRNREELEIADEIGRTSRKVIAVGSCAVYGGIPGAGDIVPPQPEALEAGVPELLEEVLPLDSRIDIEVYLPGCPPPPNLIFEALRSSLEGYGHPSFDGTVCSECTRGVEHKGIKAWSNHPGHSVPSMLCLLNRGFLCLGPVTRGGCNAACTRKGAVCIGCRGPSAMVLSSQLHSMFSDMVKFVSLTTGNRAEKTAKQIMLMLRSFYMFTRRDPVTRARVGEKVPGG